MEENQSPEGALRGGVFAGLGVAGLIVISFAIFGWCVISALFS